MLEHIEDLDVMFQKISATTEKGAQLYIGELHPFKQYAGTKARFEAEEGLQIVTCFNHNITDFINAAKKYGFVLDTLEEYFDDGNRNNIPRILAMLFKKL